MLSLLRALGLFCIVMGNSALDNLDLGQRLAVVNYS